MLKSKKILFLSLVTSSLLFAEETIKLEEITVSANKIEENIQDVPQSISVITEEDIEQKGIKNISDLVKEIPNMNTQNSFYGSSNSFRGLNNSFFTEKNPIVIYVDGIPYYDKFESNPSLANVEQIEVLRGPQGTMYGKDAIGGVINIITKEPENEWSGSLSAEYGNDNTFNTKLNTSGAIIDNKLFAGINGSFNHTDGWIENHYSGMDKDANKKNNRKTSGFLLYKPTDNLSAKLIVTDNYEKKDFIDGFNSNNLKDINKYDRDNAKNASFEVPTFEKSKVKSQALTLSYELEKVKFDSITTHKKVDYDAQFDSDMFSYQGLNDGLKQFDNTALNTWTQELKLSSKNQDIKWLVGLYLDKEDTNKFMGQEVEDSGAVYIGNTDSVTNSKTYAIFGQTMIPLGKSFELTLGGRYQKIKKNIDLTPNMSWAGIPVNPYDKYEDKKTWNAFLPKVALSYKTNDNLTTYILVSKGYMPGGFNYFPSNNISDNNTFEAQKSINYEIGTKYIGDNFAINTSIFRMDIQDIHIYKNIGGIVTTQNADKGHSQGIEFDGTYFLTDNWSITGAVGLIQAKYDDYNNGNKKFDGEKIENTPNYTASLGISYLTESGIYGRFDFYAKGKSNFYDQLTESLYEANGGITANTKIGYKLKDWDIYSYITNITNEDYVTSTYGTWVGFNEPRRFGIGAIYKF